MGKIQHKLKILNFIPLEIISYKILNEFYIFNF